MSCVLTYLHIYKLDPDFVKARPDPACRYTTLFWPELSVTVVVSRTKWDEQ